MKKNVLSERNNEKIRYNEKSIQIVWSQINLKICSCAPFHCYTITLFWVNF
jgi:hypothetical protein